MQIEAGHLDNDNILRAAGIRRLYQGWYTVIYNGNVLEVSNVCKAKRNPHGEFNPKNPDTYLTYVKNSH